MNSSRAPPDWRLPRLHPTYARLLVIALRRAGVDPAAAVAAHGYRLAQIEAGARLTPFALVRALVQALPQAGREGEGLEIGALSPVTAHGSAGQAMIASQDLDEALRHLARFGGARARTTRFTYALGAEHAEIEMIETLDFGDIRPFILEAAVVQTVKVIAAVVGQDLDDLVCRFPYPPPPWAERYADHLPGPVEFGAARLGIRIPRAHLTLPGVSADPIAKEAAVRQCEREVAEIDLAVRRDLAPWIRGRIEGANGDYPSLDAMAEALGLSPRTLIRRLKVKGVRYRDLIDQARAELASWRLAHTSDTVGEIAADLGYGDPSNFSRTFRRWRGETPTGFRLRSRT
jgi:AraC-like DNA-binding protein